MKRAFSSQPSSHSPTFRRGTTVALTALLVGALATGCGQRSTPEPASPQANAPGAGDGTQTAAPGTTGTTGTSTQAVTAAPAKPKLPDPIVVKDAGLLTPESVLYDAEADVYLVSNVNGGAMDVDRNGFISKVGADGKVLELKWIDGGTGKGVQLSAPKGMALSGNILYVADITFLRTFDRKTGKPLGKIAVPKATFVNALAAGPDGSVFISDSGLKMGKDGFEPTGTDSIHKLAKGGAVKPLLADKDLGAPNGLLPDANGGVWYVTYRSGELGYVDKDGKKGSVQKLPKGGLDGIAQLPDGSVLVSSWDAGAVYRGKPGGEFTPVLENVKSPAGIGFDTKRSRLLIPQFQDNAVHIQPLGDLPPVQGGTAVPAAAPPAADDKGKDKTPPAAAGKPAATPPATPAASTAPGKSADKPGATPATPAKPATPAQTAPPTAQKSGATPATPASPATPPADPKGAKPAPASAPAGTSPTAPASAKK